MEYDLLVDEEEGVMDPLIVKQWKQELRNALRRRSAAELLAEAEASLAAEQVEPQDDLARGRVEDLEVWIGLIRDRSKSK